jgi:hypothetical protein
MLIRQANREIKRTLPWVSPRLMALPDLVHLYRTVIHELPQEAHSQLASVLANYRVYNERPTVAM